MRQTIDNPIWVTITDKSMLIMILSSYRDEDKKKILNIATRPKTIPEIVHESKLSKTLTYRKVQSLLQDYLLFPAGHTLTKNQKLVTKYVSLFEELETNIEKNDVSVRAKINKNSPSIFFKMVGDKVGSTLEEKIIRKIKHSQNEQETIRRLVKHLKKSGLKKIKLTKKNQS
ncbi:MAG TPA: hypothetical protein VEU72_01985 [Nitrosopumilaceae archaeon]|nr:hypothetical protein [Nitrosopumilaceae archaeon]